MAERRDRERRATDRRRPSERLDVTRGEFDNLLSQVVRNARAIQRIEQLLERRLRNERRHDERRAIIGGLPDTA